MMKRSLRWAGQVVLYGLFALVIGVFSRWPAYRPLPADQALIKVSFVHHGQRVAECRQLSAEELAKLPPNMRSPMKCERERSPVVVEVDFDGQPALRHTAAPSGLSRDGASSVYRRFAVPAGEHRIVVRLRDTKATAGFNHQREATVVLKPAQVLVIDFDGDKGEISLS